MKIPKIVFRPMSLEKNIDRIKWAFYEDNDSLDVHRYTVEYYPELEEIDTKTPKEVAYKKIEQVVRNQYNKNYDELEKEVERYNRIWDEYNEKYFPLLSKYLNTNWPEDKLVINAEIGFIPVCPRYIDTYSFDLYTDMSDLGLIRVCAHETLHFLWFKKWMEMYPDTPIDGNEIPDLVWKYSEMITDPVLNNKPFDIFNFKEEGYDSFYEMYDGDELVMDKLRKLYEKDMTIEEKIDKGFKYIERIENEKNSTKKR